MRSALLIFFCMLLQFLPLQSFSQSYYYPPLTGSTWDTISPASLGWCQPQLDSLVDYLELCGSKAFLVLKDGRLVVEKYYGGFTVDSLWYWASAGKSLTSFLVGVAQQEGYLSIDDTTSNIIGPGWTSCSPIQEQRITLREQITMTTGLNDGVPDKDCTDPGCLQYLADPGTRWAYHNAPYTLLDTVLETATGQSLNIYLQQKVKSPTGMTGFYVQIGYNNVFLSTARSMARYGSLIMNGGSWNGNAVMTDTAYFQQMLSSSQGLNQSYGYLWWLNGKSSHMLPGSQFVFSGSLCPNAPSDMVAALGKNGQILNVVPSMGLVVLRMGDEPNAGFVPNFFNDTIWQKLNAAMCQTIGMSEQSESQSITISPNPVSAGDEIVVMSGFNGSCFLYEPTGRLVRRFDIRTGENRIPSDDMQPGVFILAAESGGTSVFRRLVVR